MRLVKNFGCRTRRKGNLLTAKRTWKDKVKMEFIENNKNYVEWIHLAKDRIK
jgi:hypothetical protein